MAFLASMRLFSRYRSILVKLIIAFLLHQFDNVAKIAVQHSTNLSENLCADMLILTQFGKSSGRNSCGQAQILLFHILIDQEFPQFIVANGHNNTSCAGFILIWDNFSKHKVFCLLKIYFSDFFFFLQIIIPN